MARAFPGQEKMLLCIDDSESILQFEKSLFEKSGYIVVTAPSARQGLRLASIFNFDAVLLDYQMPDMNGHEVALALRRLKPETLVVMFSVAKFRTRLTSWSMLSYPKLDPSGNCCRPSLDSLISNRPA
jgi:CheY-like chemotaxis protein